MNKVKFFIIKKIREHQYKNYLEEHRDNIKKAFYELVMNENITWIDWSKYHEKLYERILLHDMSKYSDYEFDAYREYYFPVTEMEKVNAKDKFEAAWEHHWKNNRHHWQARENDRYEEGDLSEEQILDCLENVCDWLAMGYVKDNRPYEFYTMYKDNIKLPILQRKFMERIIFEGIDKEYNN